MAAQDQSPGRDNPLGNALALMLTGVIGLFFAEMIAPFGITPRGMMRAWWPRASEELLAYAPGGNAGWRLFGWFLVVLVGLNWRALLAGGVAALRVAVILFIAAALAYAFRGDTTLWKF